MNSKFDVIIVGAGPAGLACADALKNSSYSVLLLEKNEKIGPKVCAGGLTRLDSGFDIPQDKSREFKTQHIFANGKEHKIQLAFPLRTISRSDLGQYQLDKLKEAKNIHISTQTSVLKINSTSLQTSKGIFEYSYLVGADGSNSRVRKFLKLPFEQNMGLYYTVDQISNQFEWYVNTKAWGSAYLWVFPHQQHTNIGFHFNPQFISGARAKKILEQFLNEKGYSFKKADFRSAPLNYNFQAVEFDTIFLAGDAAGLVSKATGEGIAMALSSGKEIGHKILDPHYKMPELRRVIRILNRHRQMIDRFDRNPFWQAFFFRLFLLLMKSRRFQKYFGN
jgi:geranylgeranyl reductase